MIRPAVNENGKEKSRRPVSRKWIERQPHGSVLSLQRGEFADLNPQNAAGGCSWLTVCQNRGEPLLPQDGRERGPDDNASDEPAPRPANPGIDDGVRFLLLHSMYRVHVSMNFCATSGMKLYGHGWFPIHAANGGRRPCRVTG
jgi:hypothetical protein